MRPLLLLLLALLCAPTCPAPTPAAPPLAPSPAAPSPRVEGVVLSVWPLRGPETGGTRVVLRGRGLPAFAAGVSVRFGAWGRLQCSDVRVEEPLTALSCLLPRCARCGEVRLTVAARGGAPLRGAPAFTFDSECYGAAADSPHRARAPLLPPRYSGAENCTVCRLAAAGALATLGDAATHADLRAALQRVCASAHVRSAGRVREEYCRADLQGACLALYHTDALPLAEALWRAWRGSYELGRLPDEACTRIGRCPSREWRRTHSHLEEWRGG